MLHKMHCFDEYLIIKYNSEISACIINIHTACRLELIGPSARDVFIFEGGRERGAGGRLRREETMAQT